MEFVNQTEKETRKSQNFVMRKFAFKLFSLMSLVRILRGARAFLGLFLIHESRVVRETLYGSVDTKIWGL